jgi:hypothetical protein
MFAGNALELIGIYVISIYNEICSVLLPICTLTDACKPITVEFLDAIRILIPSHF